ncbi:MAG: hypothetical protein PHT62_00130 [Desulfotomaculaceae bacterium]|nr:hypothetical protein [Desulfotomaculaceae bacterium]
MPEEKGPKEVNEEEIINKEANEEAAQDYIRIIEEEEYEEDPFDWF